MSPVSLQRDGTVAVITIDSPPVNALSQAVRQNLTTTLDTAILDADIEAIVIICAGRTFIAGADIKEFGKPPEAPHLPDVVNRIEACNKPVIAAIHGAALGGGLEVALACHYRVATESASVGFPEVKLGLLPGASGTQRLPRLTGVECALDMMLSGNQVSAPEAKEHGIVDELTEFDLQDAALEYARSRIPAGPRRIRDMIVPRTDPNTFRKIRERVARSSRGLLAPEKIIRCVELSTKLDFDAGCAAEREMFLQCKASPQSAGLRHAFFAERAVARVPGISRETPQRELQHIAVIGAGTMGAGIAYSCLVSGYDVFLLDNDEAGLQRGETTIKSLFDGGVARGKINAAAMAAGMSRLRTGTKMQALERADLIVEAVFENMAVKKDIFTQLDRVCQKGAILASNTSTLDIDQIAAATSRPQDVIGLHFFSPAHIMRLLEIVRGQETSNEVIATSLQFAKRLRKIGVVVGNCFGFVGNRMLYSYGRENQLLLLEGAAPEFIDKTLQDWGMAMGPNAVGDLAGLDVGYKARQERQDLPDDPRFYRVADMLAELGRFGQKTGKGMYLYAAGSRTPIPDPEVHALIRAEAERLGIERRDIEAEEIIDRCILGLVTEGARILEDGKVYRSGDIDVVWTNGYGFPKYRGGPMHYADTIGIDKVHEKVCEFRDRFGPEYWEPPAILESLAKGKGKFSDVEN